MSQRPRVLIVDDDPIFRAIAAEALLRLDVDVAEAADGDEALTALRATPAALVVTDINMPNRDGIELVVDIVRHWPATPVIVVSGGTSSIGPDLFLRTAEALGAWAVTTKPIHPPTFAELAARALAGGPRP